MITGVNFVITSTNLYVPIFNLSTNDNILFFRNKKQRFKGTISWKNIDLK